MTQSVVKGIDYFNRGHFLSRLQSSFSLTARRQMFEVWQRAAGQTKGIKILDVGSTPDTQLSDSNCWLPWFLETGAEVHLDSPEAIEHLASVFPGTKVVASNRPWDHIPLDDSSYDWAVSSATLEHVGGRSQQISFIREMGRVGKAIFLTSPNRYHWLEFHTKLPFIHWLPRPAHRMLLRLLGQGRWAEESLLRLVGPAELIKIAVEALGSGWKISLHSVKALGMTSNLILLAERKRGDV